MNRRRSFRRGNGRRSQSKRSMGTRFDRGDMRLTLLLIVLVTCFGSVSGRLLWFGFVPVKEPSAHLVRQADNPPRRGNIYDRNGVLLATSLQAYSVYADPKLVLEPEISAKKLAPIVDKPADQLASRMQRNGRFIWLARQLTPSQAQQVHALGIPGVGLRAEDVRLYPQQQLAAHVLGGVNVDGRGIAGIEQTFDSTLQQGQDVHLTLDLRLQQQLRQTLSDSMQQSEAKAAAGVLSDPKTGELLALVSLPDFDPNQFGHADANARFNRTTQAVFEMGSTFKLFTVAQALEKGITTLDEQFDCRKPLKVAGGFTIHDYYPEKRHLTTAEVVKHSSNIGAAQLAEKVGYDLMKQALDDLKLMDRLAINGAPTAKPLTPARWGPVELMTVSYGHGIAVTPMHVASAIGAIVTDGVVKNPTLVKVAGPPAAGKPVFSESTRTQVKGLMQLVVESGTASKAGVYGYTVGGKTGTAQKLIDGAYAKGRNVSSFAGAAPLDDPQIVGVMLIDEGKRGYHTGGRVAAPAFGQVLSGALPILGIAPQAPSVPTLQPLPLPHTPSPVPNPLMVNQKIQQLAHAPVVVSTAAH